MIKVKLINGLALELKAQTEAGEALKALGVASDHRVVAALVDGEMLDLSRPLAQDCTIAPILLDSPRGLRSCAIPRPTSWPRRCATCSRG